MAASLFSLLDKIPATFWGVVAGSLFTLFGTWLTNRASEKRLEQESRHEIALAREERELALKREVYLPAASAVVAGVGAITRLSNLEVSYDLIMSEWQSGAPALARATLVATDATLDTLIGFQTEFQIRLVRLSSMRMPLTIQLQERDAALEQVKEVSERHRQMAGQVMALKPPVPAAEVQALSDATTQEYARLQTALAAHKKASRTLSQGQFAFLKTCTEEAMALSDLTIPVIASVRGELGLSFDVAKFRAMSEKSQATVKREFDSFIAQMQSFEHDTWES